MYDIGVFVVMDIDLIFDYGDFDVIGFFEIDLFYF